MDKKGFFFTVMALILISFIFISVQLWAQGVSATEQRYADKFKVYSMQNALSIASEESFSNFANASLIYAVTKFATSLEENPSADIRGVYNTRNKKHSDPNSYPNDPEGIFYLNKSIYEMMVYGNTSGYLTDYSNSWPPREYFYEYTQIIPPEEGGSLSVKENLTYLPDEMRYTLDNYFATTQRAANLIGYNISWGKPTKFAFNQSDEWTLNVYFEVPMNFSDLEGRLQTRKTLLINTSVDIHGLTDPYVAREHIKFMESGSFSSLAPLDVSSLPHRNVYHIPKYEERDDASAQVLKDGSEGLGWFFGPAVYSSDVNKFLANNDYRYNLSKIGSYILITNSADQAIKYSGSFGAVILVSSTNPVWETVRTFPVHPNLSPQPPCQYKELKQRNCLFCIEMYEQVPNTYCDPSVLPDYLKEAKFTQDTIPNNVNLTYIVVDSVPTLGSGTYPEIRGSYNYHLKLPEFLIKNQKNFSYICDTNDETCNSNEASRLMQKFGTPQEHQIWDMTGPRDMAICGFYVASDYGPSYLQRFLSLKQYDDSTPYSSLGFGIESFNVGGWAGGFLDTTHNPSIGSRLDSEVRSRVDYQFYSTMGASIPYCAAPFYEGMPGCKSWEMCSNNTLAKSVGVGRFGITNKIDNPAYDYNIDELLFDPYDWSDKRSCQ